MVGQILNGDFVGGLILVDRKRFQEVKQAMQTELERTHQSSGV